MSSPLLFYFLGVLRHIALALLAAQLMRETRETEPREGA